MPDEAFLLKDGKEFGPFSPSHLKQMAAAGMIGPDDLIRKGQDGKPILARKIAGLVDAFGGAAKSASPQPNAAWLNDVLSDADEEEVDQSARLPPRAPKPIDRPKSGSDPSWLTTERVPPGFDPYHVWLGIPKGKRPPTHYQLLRIGSNEHADEVIEAAAERQAEYVRKCKIGEYAKFADRILYEIEEAKLCLLNPRLRKEYDEELAEGKPSPAKKRVMPPPGKPVGEGNEIATAYFKIVSILTAAFILTAVVSFMLPWKRVVFSKGGQEAEVANVAAVPAPVQPAAPLPAGNAANPGQNPKLPARVKVAQVQQPNIAPNAAAQGPVPPQKEKNADEPVGLTKLRELRGHTAICWAVCFLPNGRTLASAGDTTVRLWDVSPHARSSGHVVLSDRRNAGTGGLSASPDGSTLVASHSDGRITLWDVRSNPPVVKNELDDFNSGVPATAISPNGKWLAAGERKTGTVRLWDLSAAQPGGPIRLEHENRSFWSITFSPDSKTMAVGIEKGIWFWDLTETPPKRTFAYQDVKTQARTVRYAPDGRKFAFSDMDLIRIVDAVSFATVGTLKGHTTYVISLEFSPDGMGLLSGGYDHTIRLWNPVTMKQPLVQQIGDDGKHSTVEGVAFSPDGKLAASCGNDKIVRLWRVSYGQSGPSLLDANANESVQPQVLAVKSVPPIPDRNEVPFNKQVRDATRRAQKFLTGVQKNDGSFGGLGFENPRRNLYTTGVTSLAVFALLESGMNRDDPAIAHSLDFLRTSPLPDSTYEVSTMLLALVSAHDWERDRTQISTLAEKLRDSQTLKGTYAGTWNYGRGKLGGGHEDNCNTGFAIAGLHAAAQAGVRVQRRTWQLTADHLVKCQNDDGGWGYHDGDRSTGSMTCSGVASLLNCSQYLTGVNADGRPKSTDKRAAEHAGAVKRGIDWLGEHFTVQENPGHGTAWVLFYLFEVARAGHLSGQQFFGPHDWHREEAGRLIEEQDRQNGNWNASITANANEWDKIVATSFGLLVLSKSKPAVERDESAVQRAGARHDSPK
jgi:WD40 repeat protein